MLDNFSPHLTTKLDQRVGEFAAASNIELAYVPTNASWLNPIEPQFTGLRYFALDGLRNLGAARSRRSPAGPRPDQASELVRVRDRRVLRVQSGPLGAA